MWKSFTVSYSIKIIGKCKVIPLQAGVAQRVGRGIAVLLQAGVVQRVGRGIAVLLQARCGPEGG